MNLFYHPNPLNDNILDPEESHHCVKVLRKVKGDSIHIIDGNGGQFEASILEASTKACSFQITNKNIQTKERTFNIHIAIAPTKSMDRIEWFIEKACELGIDEISFIQTQRSERKHMNLKRARKKAISALKQSKNLHLTQINELDSFDAVVNTNNHIAQKFIAFVDRDNPTTLASTARSNVSTIVFIGPEGDFTETEVGLAKDAGAQCISLGNSVLRTETAGLIAAHTFLLVNEVSKTE